jgi:transposase
MKTDIKDTELNEKQVTISASEYADLLSLKSENETLKKQIDWLIGEAILNKKKEFGSSSEKTDYLQLDLFNESEVFYEDSDAPEAEVKSIEVKAHTKRKRKELPSKLPDNIQVEVIECILDENDMACDVCGSDRHVIGKELARRELKLIPAKAEVREYWQNTYGCRNCENTGIDVPIKKASVPNAVIKGGFASPESIAHIATQKFVMGSPLYRQEQELKAKGIELSRQTMSNWLIKATELHLLPIYEKMKIDIKDNEVLHADETTLQVLREPGKRAQSRSYMWLYRTGGDNKYPIILYEYQPDRKNRHPREFLDYWKGYLHTDGYVAYKSLPEDISIVCCFSHARRKFTDALTALENHPDSDKKKTIAGKGASYCNALFKIERDIKDIDFAEKKAKRQKFSKPILDEMFTWLNGVNASGKSQTGIALTYLKNQWKYLIKYIDDGRLEISNNRAERSIKPFVIGRKNFLFANTPKGAQTSAVLYSIIETAKENGLDPYRYLTYIFTKSPNMKEYDLEELMPFNPEVTQNCKPLCGAV